ncbi:MAG: thymidine kinase [Phycisphaerae bacterium]|nr:thymidine kinase [Phycisphaerae bacterium]NUQ44421.1 thymidine kinase [Phycisphaerae bacterium]
MSEPTRAGGGRLEVIAGCMFSGKTGLLIARLRAARSQGRNCLAFKHSIDDRYDADHLITHTLDRFDAIRVPDAAALLERSARADVVGVDEGHFFGRRLIDAMRRMTGRGQRVIIAGIDHDAWGRPFTPMPELIEMADDVQHLFTACRVCGGQARFSQRMVPVDSNVMVGGADLYQPRCARCFEPLEAPPPEFD